MKSAERNTDNDSIARDVDEVNRQLSALREDMAKLAESLTDIGGRRTSSMATDIADGFGEAREYALRTGRSAEAKVEGSFTAHPFLAIGLAVGAGLLIGAFSRR